jgi:hypothetical protein
VSTRADDLAYFLHGDVKGQVPFVAHWMGTRTFKEYKTSPKNVWAQMVLSPDVSLRWRNTNFTDKVAVRFAA